MIYSATVAFTLFFAQAARALPAVSPSIYPPSSTEPTSYSSTASPYSSPYSTTEHYPMTTDGLLERRSLLESYPPASATDHCQCYSTPAPYLPMDKKGNSYSSDYYPTSTTSSCPCYSSIPYYSSQLYYTSSSYPSKPSYTSSSYSSQPPYTSSSYPSQPPYTSSSYPSQPPYTSSSYPSQPPYTSSSYPSPKETYPPTTTPSPYEPSSKPVDGNQPGPKVLSSLRATYDTTYDNKDGSLNGVACSNGPNGLAARFPTFGDVPSFPFIGGAFDVVWNSPNCGSCWNLTNTATGVSISLSAVDSAGAGFNIAQEAFEKLNNGQIGQGVLDVIANKISPLFCGL
ncbi:Cerato-platanin-domain-containing protein [Russula vinacea]|nr:Cerato-platanin-domain-containing protein [Russula vinacea]